jgi:hypothetical protein
MALKGDPEALLESSADDQRPVNERAAGQKTSRVDGGKMLLTLARRR